MERIFQVPMLHSYHVGAVGKRSCCNMMTATLLYSEDVINGNIKIKHSSTSGNVQQVMYPSSMIFCEKTSIKSRVTFS